MIQHVILGTAGHIDHGKTALVRALTGIDCDRLPEEKARGITIDLGFAWFEAGGFRIGIVDVPGHERFVKNMLAGATGIDLALFVVAADDGIMPQTREHFDILNLLALRRGVIALTKCDLVDATARDVVSLEIRELVRGSFLADAPLICTSATTGDGIEDLRRAIADQCAELAGDEKTASSNGVPTGWFRLAIDRSFVVQGHGTVVTGSVVSGSVSVGDELEWLPSRTRVRVRSLHNHDNPVDEVHRGMRAAINLAGVSADAIERGQELATPGYLIPSRSLTVRLRASPEARRPLRHRTPVRVHIGTAEILGIVSLLDADALAPGQWGVAQLFLESPATATWIQPFVVRESSSATTLGGGCVLQPVARKIRRKHTELIERAETLIAGEPPLRAKTVAWFHGPGGLTDSDLQREAGIPVQSAADVTGELVRSGDLVEFNLGANRSRWLSADVIADIEQRILGIVQALHVDSPLVTAHDRKMVQSRLDYVGDSALVQDVVDRLLQQGKLVGDARRIALSEFRPKLSANQRKLLERVVAEHRQAGFQPPDPGSFARLAGGNAASLGDIFEVAVAEADLVRISDQLFLHRESANEMEQRVRDALSRPPGRLTVAEIRDLLGTTRKYAIPFCEYLDRAGVTRREGDFRVLPDANAKSSARTNE